MYMYLHSNKGRCHGGFLTNIEEFLKMAMKTLTGPGLEPETSGLTYQKLEIEIGARNCSKVPDQFFLDLFD